MSDTAYVVQIHDDGFDPDQWEDFVAYPTPEARNLLNKWIVNAQKEGMGGEFRNVEKDAADVSEGVKVVSNGYLDLVTGKITPDQMEDVVLRGYLLDAVASNGNVS